MTDLQGLLQTLDQLAPDELEQVHEHIQQRRRIITWVVPAENLAQIAEIMRPVQEDAARYSEAEIDDFIDEALEEVRRERHAKSGD